MNTKLANPAPLGLMGFGMTTVLLNIHNAGFFPLGSMILAMGLCYGGIAQVIAGILEFKKGNTFGLTAFTSYGFFWISLVTLIVMPKLGWVEAPSREFTGCYLAMWGIFTAYMFIGTLKANRALQVIFGSLTLLFFLLAADHFQNNVLLGHVAGWEGIFCGASAIYLAMAEVLNEQFGRTILPIGVVTEKTQSSSETILGCDSPMPS
ncbi:MAG: acetate uptake transporter [Pontiellaceae bacterium]|nr:acetate uptake transporter [Pontiellaceae bacterium]